MTRTDESVGFRGLSGEGRRKGQPKRGRGVDPEGARRLGKRYIVGLPTKPFESGLNGGSLGVLCSSLRVEPDALRTHPSGVPVERVTAVGLEEGTGPGEEAGDPGLGRSFVEGARDVRGRRRRMSRKEPESDSQGKKPFRRDYRVWVRPNVPGRPDGSGSGGESQQ